MTLDRMTFDRLKAHNLNLSIIEKRVYCQEHSVWVHFKWFHDVLFCKNKPMLKTNLLSK